MMMYYQNKSKKINFGFYLLVIVVVFFSLFKIIWPQNFSRYIFSPIFNSKYFISNSFSNIGVNFKDKKDLQQQILFLEEENAKLKISKLTQNFVNSQIQDYNLEFEKRTQGSISKVLNRPPFSPYDTLLILKGDNQIEVGDIVFTRGVYIGDVESVDSYTAIVKLRSSDGEKTLVKISNIEIEAEGKSGGQFISKVPKDTKIEIGDAVMVPELNYSLLGSVGQVVEDSIATFKTVYFSIPVSFQDMNFVTVIKKQAVLE